MAYCFGDSFDLYAFSTDAIPGYWDSGTTNFSLVAGRFGGRCLQNSANGAYLVKSSGANDAVHHLTCAFLQTAALTGTTLGAYLQLSDAATNQVCIVFRSDGAILLTSATPLGTVLATYAGATTLQSQWFAYEFEVVISATVGRFRVRKNGNASDDFDSGATLPTRPGANSYANKLTLGQNSSLAGNQHIDDLLWRSDASTVPFVGDIRSYVRMPASDASVAFSKVGSRAYQYNVVSGAGFNAGFAAYMPFTSVGSGTIVNTAWRTGSSGYTGNMKCVIFADNAGVPGTALGTATLSSFNTNALTTFTFGTPVSISTGKFWVGFCGDTTGGGAAAATDNVGGAYTHNITGGYAAFPVNNPSSPSLSASNPYVCTVTVIASNSGACAEPQQDGATTYVYSSNVGDTDLYNIASIAVTPASTVAVTTRAFVQKSDAGSRSGKVLLKSGGTTVDSGSAALSTTWSQMYRTDTIDPATGVAWTPTGVNSAQIGVAVSA